MKFYVYFTYFINDNHINIIFRQINALKTINYSRMFLLSSVYLLFCSLALRIDS